MRLSSLGFWDTHTHIHTQTVEWGSVSELSQLREIVSLSLVSYFIQLEGTHYLLWSNKWTNKWALAVQCKLLHISYTLWTNEWASKQTSKRASKQPNKWMKKEQINKWTKKQTNKQKMKECTNKQTKFLSPHSLSLSLFFLLSLSPLSFSLSLFFLTLSFSLSFSFEQIKKIFLHILWIQHCQVDSTLPWGQSRPGFNFSRHQTVIC